MHFCLICVTSSQAFRLRIYTTTLNNDALMTPDQCHIPSGVERRFRTCGKAWRGGIVVFLDRCTPVTVCPFGLLTIRLVVGIPSELVMRPAPRLVGVVTLGHKSQAPCHPFVRDSYGTCKNTDAVHGPLS